MVLFWGGLLAAGVYVFRRRPARPAGPPAEEILAAEEYCQRRLVLREREQRGRTS